MVRQRLISSHGHLSGKLGAGVLSSHPQVVSHYQYDSGVPLPNSDCQEALSNSFPSSRESSLLYHCFKHRGTGLQQLPYLPKHMNPDLGCTILVQYRLLVDMYFYRSAFIYSISAELISCIFTFRFPLKSSNVYLNLYIKTQII